MLTHPFGTKILQKPCLMYLPWFYILPCIYQFVQAWDVEQICWKETVQHLNFWLGVDFSPLDHAETAKPGLLQRWTKWQMQMPKSSAKPWAPWMTLEDYPMSGRCLLVAIIRKRSETLLHTCVQDSTDARCVFQLMNLHGTFVFFLALPRDLHGSHLMGELMGWSSL